MKTALAAVTAFVFAGTASANVTVTGTGKVSYTPNLAHVTIGVSSEGGTAAEAWEKNAQVVKRLFDVLKGFGIEAKDFQTTGLHVNPRYAHSKEAPPRLVGYTAGYDVSVRIRKLDRVGAVLDALVAAGANRSMSISFGIANPEELLNEARRRAVADARSKAELYVKSAGAQLGVLVGIAENGAAAPRSFRYEHLAAAGADALVIAAGQQELTASVTLTYTIRNN
jgi:uncharacterized protein YggE